MQRPKWLVVARNEYRIRTSRIRKVRRYFPFLVVGLLAFYVAFVSPRLVGLFMNDFVALMLSKAAVAVVQIFLSMIFIYFMIIPITQTLREEQTGQLEIFLAAPIKPSDVLLGEFLGQMPFYAILITFIIGSFTAVMNPLGLDAAQTAIIIMIFIVTFLSALWIGTVAAAALRTRLGKTARGRDIGRALAMVIALPLVALVYAFRFGGLLEALTDPGTSGTFKAILSFLPTSWGAEVIAYFTSNPGNISAFGFETLARLGGLVAFFLVALGLGAKVANLTYSLEPTTFTASEAKPDGVFYKTIKQIGGGGSFGTIFVSVFKDFSRRLENLTNITYILGLLVIMNVFIVSNMPTRPDDPPVAIIMAQFIFPILAVMVTGEATVRGKDSLFIYRKAPFGVGRFVKAMLMKGWLTTIPITTLVTAVITIQNPQTIISLLTTIILMMLIVAAEVAFVLGLFLLNPAFSVKSVKLWLNIMITMFVSIGLFVASILILTRVDGLSEAAGGLFYVQLVQTGLSWLVGIAFLYLGKRKLSTIE